jgi:hypothetical protein
MAILLLFARLAIDEPALQRAEEEGGDRAQPAPAGA